MTKVWIHPNAHRKAADDPDFISTKIPGVRIKYFALVKIDNVDFRIHRSGLERARREGCKNVHAWCVGDLDFAKRADEIPGCFEVSDAWKMFDYTWQFGDFYDTWTSEVLTGASSVIVHKGKWYYK